jgi:hypothetical protein
MTFDRNPKPVQFIQPNVLDRACLSVGKDDGFADQFGLRLAVLIQNILRMDLHRWHCSSMLGRADCGSTARLVPVLGRFQFAEPIDLRSKARR